MLKHVYPSAARAKRQILKCITRRDSTSSIVLTSAAKFPPYCLHDPIYPDLIRPVKYDSLIDLNEVCFSSPLLDDLSFASCRNS